MYTKVSNLIVTVPEVFMYKRATPSYLKGKYKYYTTCRVPWSDLHMVQALLFPEGESSLLQLGYGNQAQGLVVLKYLARKKRLMYVLLPYITYVMQSGRFSQCPAILSQTAKERDKKYSVKSPQRYKK